MNTPRKSIIVCCLFGLIILFGIFELKLDFSRSDFLSNDLIGMLSSSQWIYLLSLPLTALLIRRLDRRFSWAIPFVLFIPLYVIYPLVQYPNVYFWDTYRHGMNAQYMVKNGNFPTDVGYFQYPGCFVFSATFSELVGLPIIESSLILTSILVFIIMLLLLAFGAYISKSGSGFDDLAWVVPTAYIVVNFSFLTSVHYSPQLFGLCLYAVLIFIGTKRFLIHVRAWKIVLLFLLFALTVTHVFSAVIGVATLICFYFGAKRFKLLKMKTGYLVTLTTAATGVLVFSSWHIFIATGIFNQMTSFISSLVHGQRTFLAIGETLLFSPLKGPLVPILGAYRYGVYALFGIVGGFGILVYRAKIEANIILLLTSGAFLGALVIYVTPATFGVGRILLYGGIVVSIAVLYTLTMVNAHGHRLLKKVTKIFGALLPFLVIATFLTECLYYSAYSQFIHPDEIAGIEFSVAKVSRPLTITIDEALVVSFYTFYSEQTNVVDERTPQSLAQMKFERGVSSLQYLPRQLYYYGLDFVDVNKNLIYSNGLTRVYINASISSP